MKIDRTVLLGTLFVVLFVAAVAAVRLDATAAVAETAPESKAPAEEAVEPDMHEFMEYVFEPGYKRLKVVLAEKPADNKAWKAVKGDALVLAEAGNLLMHRRPEADKWTKEMDAAWTGISADVREHGGKLYRAAKKRDYESTRVHWEAMLGRCNACHDKFAGGEHQLAP